MPRSIKSHGIFGGFLRRWMRRAVNDSSCVVSPMLEDMYVSDKGKMMKVERFEVPGLSQYSYIVSSQGKAAVVDPIRDIDIYLAYAAAQGLQIESILETHIHADYASGATALAAATGAELALSAYDEGEMYQYRMPHRQLRNGDVIEIGAARIEALHTPGHTPEHLSFVLIDTERSATEPVVLLSGDFLFVGSLGRPDLLGEQAKLGLARELHRSLHQRIAHLPDSVQLYPGHGAGSLCGAGMSDSPESTLGYERATNLLFGLPVEAFVSTILASVPAMPRYYPRMKTLNAEGPPPLASLPGGESLSVADVKNFAQQGAILLDLRRPEAFGGAHIPSSLNIGSEGNLSLWAGWLLDPTKNIVLIGDTGDNDSARRALIRVGLDRIAGSLAGGFSAWSSDGMPLARTTQLAVTEIPQPASETILLDVRTDTEWAGGHIAGARHIALGDLAEHAASLPQDQPITTVCGSGYRSSIAASLLMQLGYLSVSSIAGGISAWKAQGLALSHPNDSAAQPVPAGGIAS